MGTKVSTLAEAAGVECPKSTGDMSWAEPCTKCDHYPDCLHQLGLHLEWPGNGI